MQSASDNRRHVLIALDATAGAQRAMQFYLENIRGSRSSESHSDLLLLFHSLEPPSSSSHGVVSAAMVTEVEKDLRASMTAAERLYEYYKIMLTEAGLKENEDFRWLHLLGEGAGPAVVKAAKEFGAHMVVIGSRGQGLFGRIFLGSTSEYVLHHSDIPCIVCPPPPAPTEDQ